LQQSPEEIRLTKNFGSKVEWLVGGFLADDTNNLRQIDNAAYPTTGHIVGAGSDGFYHYKYHEYAVFTDLTYHSTDRLSIQIGGRYSAVENVTGPIASYSRFLPGTPLPLFSMSLMRTFIRSRFL